MWSEEDAVKVVAYRMLKRLGSQDLLDMIYLSDEIRDWAEAENDTAEKTIHKETTITIKAKYFLLIILFNFKSCFSPSLLKLNMYLYS